MDGVVEVITGRERRRRWSVEQKLQVVGETQEPGARVSQVAARHGVCESLVFSWRRQAREGVLVFAGRAGFPTCTDERSGAPDRSEPILSGRKIVLRFVSPVAIRSDRDR